LAAAIPRIERAGFETEPVVMGGEATPALLVRSEPPVVLALGSASMQEPVLSVRDPDGGSVEISLAVGCSTAFAASSSQDAIRRVMSVSRLCHRGHGDRSL
jgi:hypothetical protein